MLLGMADSATGPGPHKTWCVRVPFAAFMNLVAITRVDLTQRSACDQDAHTQVKTSVENLLGQEPGIDNMASSQKAKP